MDEQRVQLEQLRWTYEAARHDYLSALKEAEEKVDLFIEVLRRDAAELRKEAEELERIGR